MKNKYNICKIKFNYYSLVFLRSPIPEVKKIKPKIDAIHVGGAIIPPENIMITPYISAPPPRTTNAIAKPFFILFILIAKSNKIWRRIYLKLFQIVKVYL